MGAAAVGEVQDDGLAVLEHDVVERHRVVVRVDDEGVAELARPALAVPLAKGQEDARVLRALAAVLDEEERVRRLRRDLEAEVHRLVVRAVVDGLEFVGPAGGDAQGLARVEVEGRREAHLVVVDPVEDELALEREVVGDAVRLAGVDGARAHGREEVAVLDPLLVVGVVGAAAAVVPGVDVGRVVRAEVVAELVDPTWAGKG